MRPRRVIVAGAGLAGSLLAILLGRQGHEVVVVERRPDPREGPAEGGRSINLAISTRGLWALGRAGLAESVLERAVPMRGRMLHARDGRTRFVPYGIRPDECIHSVSRAGLNRLLVEHAGRIPGVGFRFSCKVVDVDLDAPALVCEDDAGGTGRVAGDLLVGADGAFSRVRRAMARRPRFDVSQAWLAHGYRELTIPPAEGGGFRLEPNALHIWPRGEQMMIALPNHDGSFTATLFWPFEGPLSFDAAGTDAASIRARFERDYPDAVPHLTRLVEEFRENPIGSLVTIRCGPWHHRDRVVLVGDACHAVVPFYGQGANAAFESAGVLADLFARHDEPGEVFARYTQARKRHADALADLALANFDEMRDRVRSPLFLLEKKLGTLAHRLFGRAFLPLYTMVTFTRIPYADAVARARRQARLVRRAAAAAVVLLLAAGAWAVFGIR
ncbi:MAG: NAD(P)/FAD-dependent oxidoreductase [Acidobacteriota bacterium]